MDHCLLLSLDLCANWRAVLSSAGLKEVKDVVKPFDWTYSTDYKGSVTSRGAAQFEVCTALHWILAAALLTRVRRGFMLYLPCIGGRDRAAH